MNDVIEVTGVSNREFLERYARPGRIGLSGGTSAIDKAIARAQRHLDDEARWSPWSHAFFFQGVRHDGHHWVIESDLQLHRRHIRLGVQENRVAKYFDENLYTTLAVLDFSLTNDQATALLREGLELVAARTRYSLRELVGTLVALRHPEWRERGNPFAREKSFYCSAFVQHVFRKIGLDLAPGLDAKNTTPEDISRTPVPHTTYLLRRQVATSTLSALADRMKCRVRARVRKVKAVARRVR
jgi:hypothetical protein